jgi:hypothetical protein
MRFAAAAALVLTGCLTTMDVPIGSLDAGPVLPMYPKLNVMLLVDKSGSMNFPVNDQVAPCTPSCNLPGSPACPAGCATRLQELKLAMQTFLTSPSVKNAWLGMAIYPTAIAGSGGAVDACGATQAADIRVSLAPKDTDLDAEMMQVAANINTQIQALTVGGGTPTGDSLKFLGTYPPLLDPDPNRRREDIIVLITDGSPNCNANNANDCNDVAACKCTLLPADACMPSSFCTQGCLDADYTTAQIRALRPKDIRTAVIGFGVETATGDAPATLNAMALAGGLARSCPLGTECGPSDTCNAATRLCARSYYQTANASELVAVLTDLLKVIP